MRSMECDKDDHKFCNGRMIIDPGVSMQKADCDCGCHKPHKWLSLLFGCLVIYLMWEHIISFSSWFTDTLLR